MCRRRLLSAAGTAEALATEDEVVRAAQSILRSTDSRVVTEDEIRTAVHEVIAKEPNPEEVHQVAARLASVGWPLGAPVR